MINLPVLISSSNADFSLFNSQWVKMNSFHISFIAIHLFSSLSLPKRPLKIQSVEETSLRGVSHRPKCKL